MNNQDFVFDPWSRKVIGRKNNNGEIQNLTEEDLEDCNTMEV